MPWFSNRSRCFRKIHCKIYFNNTQFSSICFTRKYAAKDPTVLIETPKYEKKLPDVLDVEEVIQLLETPDLTKNNGYRDRTILELLYATGMRVTELIQIEIDDVNLIMGFVKVFGKGTKRESFHQVTLSLNIQILISIMLDLNYLKNGNECTVFELAWSTFDTSRYMEAN